MGKIKRWLADFIRRNPKINVSLLILGVTILVIILLFSTRPRIVKRAPDVYMPVVHVIEAIPGTVNIPIHVRGFAQPEKEVQIISTVTGPVIEISPRFTPGARFKKGDILLKIDPSLLQMELAKARALYEQARLSEMEINANLEARSSLGDDERLSDLAKGKPHRAVAKANAEAALAALKLAEHQLENATLRAPFDGKVMLRAINEHEMLTPGMPIAKIYSSNSFIARLPVTEEQLALIDPADIDRGAVKVTLSNPVTDMQWKGHILRSEDFISPTRLIYLVAKVHLSGPDAEKPAPLSGTLLDAEISGKPYHNAVVIPVKALKSRNTIWVLDSNSQLQIRPVTLIYRGPELAYIQAELNPGERIITSQIASVTNGMKLKPAAGNSKATGLTGQH